MLVITRTVTEQIFIGDNVVVTLLALTGNRAKLGISAAQHVPILRREVVEHKKENGQEIISDIWTNIGETDPTRIVAANARDYPVHGTRTRDAGHRGRRG